MAAPRKPQDHKSPAQVEAEAPETITVVHGKLEFSVATDADEWPAEAILAFEEGKPTSAVRGILGPEQWAQLMATRPRGKDIGALMEQIAEAMGFESSGN